MCCKVKSMVNSTLSMVDLLKIFKEKGKVFWDWALRHFFIHEWRAGKEYYDEVDNEFRGEFK